MEVRKSKHMKHHICGVKRITVIQVTMMFLMSLAVNREAKLKVDQFLEDQYANVTEGSTFSQSLLTYEVPSFDDFGMMNFTEPDVVPTVIDEPEQFDTDTIPDFAKPTEPKIVPAPS